MADYTTVQQVADHLGVDLTGLQSIEAARLIPAASAWIDGRTGRTWGATDPTTETQTVVGQGLYLRKVPVASVASVSIRSTYVNATWSAVSYELLDAAQGLLLLPWGYAGWLAQVVYTPAQVVDPQITLAATMLTAHWLRAGVAAAAGISDTAAAAGPIIAKRVGSVEVRYANPPSGAASASGSGPVPDAVLALLPRTWVVV